MVPQRAMQRPQNPAISSLPFTSAPMHSSPLAAADRTRHSCIVCEQRLGVRAARCGGFDRAAWPGDSARGGSAGKMPALCRCRQPPWLGREQWPADQNRSRVDATTGVLTPARWQSTQGAGPRFIGLDPAGRFLYAANESGDTIVAFAVDRASGGLRPTGQVIEIGSPVTIVFSTNF